MNRNSTSLRHTTRNSRLRGTSSFYIMVGYRHLIPSPSLQQSPVASLEHAALASPPTFSPQRHHNAIHRAGRGSPDPAPTADRRSPVCSTPRRCRRGQETRAERRGRAEALVSQNVIPLTPTFPPQRHRNPIQPRLEFAQRLRGAFVVRAAGVSRSEAPRNRHRHPTEATAGRLCHRDTPSPSPNGVNGGRAVPAAGRHRHQTGVTAGGRCRQPAVTVTKRS
jgi:hypothetical protein